jgi:hypothetical protein
MRHGGGITPIARSTASRVAPQARPAYRQIRRSFSVFSMADAGLARLAGLV